MSEFTLAKDISITSGFAFSSASFDPEHGEPLIRIRDIQGQKTVVKYTGTYSEEYVVETGDLLVGMDGDFNVVRWLGAKALLNQRVCKIESVSDEVHQGFLFWYLQPKLKEIHAVTPQTTVKHLSVKDIYAIEKPCLNYLEQEMIANILDTLDYQIRETEAIIAKLQHVKLGLLHDLLTRGVDENGELRPSYEDAPHLYKPSELGWIPNDWDTTELNEVLIGSPTNGIYKSAKDIGSGALMIGQTSFTKERSIDFNQCRRASVSPQELSLYGVQEGNILVTRVFAVPAGVGLPTLVPEVPEDSVFESNMMRLVVNLDQAVPLILFELMKSHSFRGQVLKVINASNQSSINQSNLSDTLLPKIGIEEQRVMEKIILEAKNSLSKEQEKLKKQRLMKSGLMDDLLTGKVRVTELLNQEQAS